METLHFIGWWLLVSLIVGVAVGHAIRNTQRNEQHRAATASPNTEEEK